MLLTDEFKGRLAEALRLLDETRSLSRITDSEAELADLLRERETPDFFLNLARAQKVNKRAAALENKIAEFNRLARAARDLGEYAVLADAEGDERAFGEAAAELKKLFPAIEKAHLSAMLRGEYDGNNAIMNLHSGAGGTESCDWADMLYRMYTRWCERSNFAVRVLDYQEGDGAGLKNVTFSVVGPNAYGYLKAEKGVHRLVRISPFDANKRRHTSFASAEVMPEIDDDGEIEIRGEDLKIDTYRSSGAGGQHVNKTESAIRITHLPTGIVVACQNERSQMQNRETAMKMLKSRLAEIKEREATERAAGIKGEIKKIEWGSQIRSYVFCPYTMVKDHRTNYETSDVSGVMDGDIDAFIFEYLKRV